jgi:hypothetical protein
MAIEWGLLSQGLEGPTPYEQQKARGMQAQIQQQQLAGAQSQTRASEMQLQQMIESSNRTKKFAETIAQKGGNPGDWMSVAKALHDTGDITNVTHAQQMIQDHYEADKLASLMEYKAPPSFDKWLAKQSGAAPAAAQMPAPAAPAAPAAPPVAAVPDITALAAGGNMPTNNLIPAVGATPAVIENKLVPGAADKSLPVVKTEETTPLTSAERIAGIAQTKKGPALATVLARLENPSEIKKIEDEIAILRKDGVPETDNAIKSRRALLDATVYGKDPEYAGYIVAKGEGYKGNFLDYKKLDANLKRVKEAPAAAVEVLDPITGKPKFVSREEAIRLGLAPASSAEKPLSAAQTQKATKERAVDAGRFRAAKDTANELEKLADSLLGNPEKNIPVNPGLAGITGYNALIPSLPNTAARGAQQQLETFKGKIMALGRSIQSAEGKLGNMAVQEWKFVSDAVQKLDPAAPNFPEQLRDVVRQARDLQTKVESSFIDTYGENPVSGKPAGSNKAAGGKKPAAALPPGFVPDK